MGRCLLQPLMNVCCYTLDNVPLIKKGDDIALSGDSGKVTAPHLHFEIFKNAKPVDPSKESLYAVNYNRILNGFLVAIPLYIFFLKKRL